MGSKCPYNATGKDVDNQPSVRLIFQHLTIIRMDSIDEIALWMSLLVDSSGLDDRQCLRLCQWHRLTE